MEYREMKIVLTAVCLAIAQQIILGQTAPTLPAWLENYPGASPETHVYKALVQSTYITPAAPSAVVEHYRALFESQKLPFLPNPDGIGTVIRGEPSECSLLITIHPLGNGSFVDVGCAAKSNSSSGTTM